MGHTDARHPIFNREFRYLWIGNTVSGCGDQFFLVALPWLILQLTGSGAVFGGIIMVQAIPRAALMLRDPPRVESAVPPANIVHSILEGLRYVKNDVSVDGFYS